MNPSRLLAAPVRFSKREYVMPFTLPALAPVISQIASWSGPIRVSAVPAPPTTRARWLTRLAPVETAPLLPRLSVTALAKAE